MAPARAGFTLIELMVVISIIGLLAATLIPSMVGERDAGGALAEQANLRWHDQAIQRHEQRRGYLPLMATDNDRPTATFLDGSVFVLVGGGAVRRLTVDPDFIPYGWDVSRCQVPFPAGLKPPHPLLQRLEKSAGGRGAGGG